MERKLFRYESKAIGCLSMNWLEISFGKVTTLEFGERNFTGLDLEVEFREKERREEGKHYLLCGRGRSFLRSWNGKRID